MHRQAARIQHSPRKYLLRYNMPDNKQEKITKFTFSVPVEDLNDSWGHSLPTIDATTTFRIFLQNLNGLALYKTNYFLQQDLQTFRDYGAAAIALPETKVNWELSYQREIFGQMLRHTWINSVYQTSWAQEPFLSNYQPGVTATIICDNWASRVMDKREDPMGLGRWSYITLRGKGTKWVVIVTAYNICTTHNSNSGDTTAYKQQHRILRLSCFVSIIAKLPRIPTVKLFLIYNPGWRP